NVVRLLGSLDDIERRLLEFSDRPSEIFEADRYRPLLLATSGRFGVLTQAQERLAVTRRSGVGMVSGSSALGVGRVPDSLLRALLGQGPLDDNNGRPRKQLTVIPNEIVTGNAFSSWLTQYVKQHPPTQGDLVIQIVEQDTARLVERLDAANAF